MKKDGTQVCSLVKGTVHASVKKNSYVVYVHLDQSTGGVVYANCLCKAGKGGCCKHVAALLFQILDYIQLELVEVPDDLTCTQLLQQWHVPRSDETDEPVLVEDLHFEKASYEKDVNGTKYLESVAVDYNPTPHFARISSPSKIERLAQVLEEANKVNYLNKLLKSNSCQPIPFDELHNCLPSKRQCTEDSTYQLHDTDIREKMLDNLKEETTNWMNVEEDNKVLLKEKLGTTHGEFLEIERNTRGQSECTEWHAERKIRLTASNFGAVLKRRKQIYPKTLLKKLQSQPQKHKVPAPCKWGKDNEEIAAEKYMKFKQEKNEQVKVCASCGLIVNRAYPWLGASPDILISDVQETSPLDIGEIKCTYSKKELSIEDLCKDNDFYLSMINGKAGLKKDHVYYYQLQGTMAALKLQWADFIVYTTKGLHVERIYFNSKLWEQVMVPELTNFYFMYILPLLK